MTTTLEVDVVGFQKSTQTGIKLLVNQKYRADFKMSVLGVIEKIDVSSLAAQVETTNTQLGDVVEDKKMQSLPLNGRSYIDLLGLQAGVVPISSDAAINDRHPSGNGNSGNVSVNGQRESANSFLVNGGDVEESVNNGASVVPSLDSIQEFRLLTSSFNAEYGRFSGGIVNAVTKSGTNSIHGSVYEFLRNEKLDARNYFDPERGALKRNQFGGTVGGPISEGQALHIWRLRGDSSSTWCLAAARCSFRIGTDWGFFGPKQHSILVPSLIPMEILPSFGVTTARRILRRHLTSRLGYSVAPGEPYWFDGCVSNNPVTGYFPAPLGL